MRRIVVLAACAVSLSLALVACGGGTSTPPTVTTSSTVGTTTTTVPQAAVEVRPPSGPIGTSFQLLATRFQPTETVMFEIDFPSGKVFKGQAHKATADGSVTATYLATSGNPAGTYQVKATGDKGTQASGQFEITAGAGRTTTTVAGRTTTTAARTTTTKKP